MDSPETVVIIWGLVLAAMLAAVAVIVLRRLRSGAFPVLLHEVLDYLRIFGAY